jgi:poly(3-hydroxybutyrate) depolymerase
MLVQRLRILFLCLLLPTFTFATDLSGSIPGSVSDGKTTIPYRIFEPQLTSPDERVPLILFLAGAGDRGTDNVSQTYWMASLRTSTESGQYAAFLLAPQLHGRMQFSSSGSRMSGGGKLTMQALAEAMQNPNVDPTRIYLTGISLGSKGTWDLLRRFPHLFAAAVPMSYGGDPSTAKAVKDVPIWAFHGSADEVISASTTRKMIAAIRKAGGHPLYTEVPNGEHTMWYRIYKDPSLYAWMFAQSNPNPYGLGSLGSAKPAMVRYAGTEDEGLRMTLTGGREESVPVATSATRSPEVLDLASAESTLVAAPASLSPTYGAAFGADASLPVAVPEPTSVVLVVAGAWVTFGRRLRCGVTAGAERPEDPGRRLRLPPAGCETVATVAPAL